MTKPMDDIYKIISFKCGNDTINARIVFNENHPIFAGHFPGNPIVPGVIQIRIIKDLLEKGLGQKLMMVQGRNIKFLNIISPVKTPKTEIRIGFQNNEEQTFTVQASLFSETTIFMKLNGVYQLLN
ncbi:MAG: hypothetical protein FJY07_12650 [Bacteroidetes bacterium]|nr:hypothetical protein [Bacteroidota bacterium]